MSNYTNDLLEQMPEDIQEQVKKKLAVDKAAATEYIGDKQKPNPIDTTRKTRPIDTTDLRNTLKTSQGPTSLGMWLALYGDRTADEIDALRAEVERLKGELAENNAAAIQQIQIRDKEIATANQRIAELGEQIAIVRNLNDYSQNMVAEGHKKNANAQKELANLRHRVKELEAQLNPPPPKMPEPISYHGGQAPKQYLREED